jgi:hypothetical protein
MRKFNQSIKMLKFNFLLFVLFLLIIGCSNRQVNEIRDEVSFSKLDFDNFCVKHLLYHPFHRLHKKHMLHRQRKHPHKHGNHSSIRRKLNRHYYSRNRIVNRFGGTVNLY